VLRGRVGWPAGPESPGLGPAAGAETPRPHELLPPVVDAGLPRDLDPARIALAVVGAIVAGVADGRGESRVAQINGRSRLRAPRRAPPGGPNRATRLRVGASKLALTLRRPTTPLANLSGAPRQLTVHTPEATDDAPPARRAAPPPALSRHPPRDETKESPVPTRLAGSVLRLWKTITVTWWFCRRDEHGHPRGPVAANRDDAQPRELLDLVLAHGGFWPK
jgi:hypothetical protein